MIRPIFLAGAVLSLLPVSSWASAPRVAVDIAPLHSVVTQVMKGVGEPELLIQPEASPHSYSLRPSEAEALAEAQVVFWISGELTPWLENSLENLAGSATKVEMLALSETVKYGFREGATFEAHAHGEHGADGGHDERSRGQDSHDQHHDEHQDEHHEDHHAGHDGHHHGEHDPHAWLDPMNAKIWSAEIAQALSEVDPANASVYQNNAKDFAQSMDNLIASLQERADRIEGIRFIVFHDAYQYFERRFGLLAAGAISVSDASDPSPARIREIQSMVSELGVTCAFTEPQYDPGLVKTVFEGSKVKTVGVMDPLGADLQIGGGQYSLLLEALMNSLEKCR
ncbi:zinc ABC transporter substrate-binding protein [Marinobacter nauticus]|uniref:zinc ABC transporter substrate-binding protein n=1 Tax=Marinobacter nauticus TaxID=2743 RepID=UPI0024316BB1|nr:zinc ABC transporter substrate-binding protein [Marinobacter nauticus]